MMEEASRQVAQHALQEWTPLHNACIENRVEDVRMLLDGGADIEATGLAVRTALYRAKGI